MGGSPWQPALTLPSPQQQRRPRLTRKKGLVGAAAPGPVPSGCRARTCVVGGAERRLLGPASRRPPVCPRPDALPAPENCVELYGAGPKRGRWNDVTCSAARYFVCSIPAAMEPEVFATMAHPGDPRDPPRRALGAAVCAVHLTFLRQGPTRARRARPGTRTYAPAGTRGPRMRATDGSRERGGAGSPDPVSESLLSLFLLRFFGTRALVFFTGRL